MRDGHEWDWVWMGLRTRMIVCGREVCNLCIAAGWKWVLWPLGLYSSRACACALYLGVLHLWLICWQMSGRGRERTED